MGFTTYVKTSSPAAEEAQAYIKAVGAFPPLTREEELAAFIRHNNGDPNAREEILQSNQRYIIGVALSFGMSKLSVEDLISEGNVGQARAFEKFDIGRGIRFLTYARWWIKQEMQAAMMQRSDVVTMPKRNWADCQRALMAETRLCTDIRFRPTAEEIAKEAGVDLAIARAAIIIRYGSMHVVDELSEDSDGVTSGMVLSSNDEHCMGKDYMKVKAMVRDAMALHLTEREEKVLKMMYGLDGKKPMNARQIAPTFNLSKTRISQIRDTAFAKLREAGIVHFEELP